MPRIGNVDTMDAASVVTGEVMNEDQVELRVRDELAGFPLTSPDHEKPKQSNRYAKCTDLCGFHPMVSDFSS